MSHYVERELLGQGLLPSVWVSNVSVLRRFFKGKKDNNNIVWPRRKNSGFFTGIIRKNKEHSLGK